MKLKTPADYLVVWFVMVILVGFAAAAGATALAYIVALIAAVPLLIGCVGQGVRVGMKAARDDRFIEKHLPVEDPQV